MVNWTLETNPAIKWSHTAEFYSKTLNMAVLNKACSELPRFCNLYEQISEAAPKNN
jgi:hypothetical protein